MSLDHLTEDVDRAFRESLALRTFVSVVLSGMRHATEAVEWVGVNRELAEVMRKPDPYPTTEDFENARQEAAKVEEFAKEQASRGFPYLFSTAIVRMWSILEVMVDDLVRRLLRTPEALPSKGILPELEGALLPFINASAEERAEMLAFALKQELVTPKKPGPARMENLLDQFGLAGGINSTIRRMLVELWAVRNVLVHRSGVTDKRFTEECPWLGCTEGAPLALRHNHFQIYALATDWYILEVYLRIIRKFNITIAKDSGIAGIEHVAKTQQVLLSTVERFVGDRPAGELTAAGASFSTSSKG